MASATQAGSRHVRVKNPKTKQRLLRQTCFHQRRSFSQHLWGAASPQLPALVPHAGVGLGAQVQGFRGGFVTQTQPVSTATPPSLASDWFSDGPVTLARPMRALPKTFIRLTWERVLSAGVPKLLGCPHAAGPGSGRS